MPAPKYDLNNTDHFEKFLRAKGTCWNHLNTVQRKEAWKEFRSVCAAQ